ncbi:Aminomethyltransferase [Frigidibacter albus]
MSARLSRGGRLIDRRAPVTFRFDGKPMTGFAGDTLAASLLANDQMLVGRSFKYHRPRGILASGAEEPNALVGLGQGPRFEPNQRVTTTETFEGLTAISQNHWPSLEYDIGAVNGYLSRFLPAGFYYKMFLWPRPFWKHVYEPFIRQSAGLGKVPQDADADRYEQAYAFADLVVAGGGIAGLTAALTAARAGKRVILLEQTAHWGGRAPVDGDDIDGMAADLWVKNAVQALEGMANVTMRLRTMVSGLYDHGYALAYERVADHTPGDGRPRHRLWRIRAGKVITATGAIERPLSFAGNDIPGVMLASAVRDFVVNWAVSPGDRTVVVTNNDDAYRTALVLADAGLVVAAVIDARPSVTGDLPAQVRARGIRVLEGRGIAKVKGAKRVTGVAICAQEGEGAVLEEIACDVVAMSGGWSPVVHLWSHCGGKLLWDAGASMFRPDAARPPTGDAGQPIAATAGAASGALQTAAVLADAHAAAGGEGLAPQATGPVEAPMLPVWIMPQGAGNALKSKMWLDYQNDVKVSDVQLAAREGYESVEHTKRYTTLGMATDQGKLSNINGLAVLSNALHQEIPATGTTTFRPPYTPISFGAIGAEARGEIFQPLRQTPMHDWHEAQGAYWEPVGQWRRPYCYKRGGETAHEAVNREVINTRSNIGLLDASTLGKILVKGADAGRFLDMLYTGVMSTLPVGKCRYGLMCNDNGFLIDDGVVVRLSEDRLAVPHHHRRRRPDPCAYGGLAAMRVVGLEGPHRQPDRAIRAGRHCRPQGAAAAGEARRHGCQPRGAAVHDLRRGYAWWLPGAGVPHQLLGRAELRGCGARLGRACLLAGLRGGGGRVRGDALRDRGAACAARREGLHHDRGRDRRHGDPAGPGPWLGDFQEEARLSGQARAGAQSYGRSGPLEAGGPADAGRIGAARWRAGGGRGPERQWPAAHAGACHLDLLLADAEGGDCDGAGAERAKPDGRGAGLPGG